MYGNWRRIFSLSLFVLFSLFSSGSAAPASPTAAAASPALPDSSQECILELLHEQHGARAWFRNKITRESDLVRYGLHMADGWDCIDPHRPVVVLIHGFNSTPDQNAAIMIPIQKAGYPCGTFAYPNDQPLSMSTQLLSEELRRFARQYPDRRVILVCHSMGGLIARACIENSHDNPGNVIRLVMIAPPSHGTLLAHFAVGTDVWEHWLDRKSGSPWHRFRDSVVDGLGEAADDMCPNSPFLTELNSRPRNSHVRYTVLLGTGGCLEEAQVCWMRKCVRERLAKCPGAKKSAKQIDAVLSDIDELVAGKGDGVVAIKRGRLDGVSDTLVMPFGHMAVTGEPRTDIVRDVQAAVLKRIQ
jgi:pimeloyl-ACP methyl ester carboxylesterase